MATAPARLPIAQLAAAIGASAVLATGCQAPPPPAPSPVIVASPVAVCLGDDYRTPIVLDGTQSSAALTLVPSPPDDAAAPLRYRWSLTGSKFRIATVDAGDGAAIPSGTLESDKLIVTIAANEPLQVDLEVEPVGGVAADTTATIAVTPPNDAGVCPLGDAG